MSNNLTKLFFGALLVAIIFYLVGGFDQFHVEDIFKILKAH